MGMNTAPARRAHRKAQADHKRPRPLVVMEVVLAAADQVAAVLALLAMGTGAAVEAEVGDVNHRNMHRIPQCSAAESGFCDLELYFAQSAISCLR